MGEDGAGSEPAQGGTVKRPDRRRGEDRQKPDEAAGLADADLKAVSGAGGEHDRSQTQSARFPADDPAPTHRYSPVSRQSATVDLQRSSDRNRLRNPPDANLKLPILAQWSAQWLAQ